MKKSYYAVVFAGINTNRGTFEHPGKEIERQLKISIPGCRVNILTIYPYDDSISGDTISDTVQVMKNAYNLCGNTVNRMAEEIIKKYADEEYIFFVGYSGGGVAATKTAEKLARMDFAPVSKIFRVGSPLLTVGKPFYGRTADFVLNGDSVTQVEIPRFIKNLRPYRCFIKGLKTTKHIHSCYFREDLKDSSGESNLTKTIAKILTFVKN